LWIIILFAFFPPVLGMLGKCSTTESCVTLLFCFVWQYCSLNTEPHAC
jgi:hypothetical protein